LMQDKRRRRTIVTIVTIAFILMTQIPNIANMAFQQHQSETKTPLDEARDKAAERAELFEKWSDSGIDPLELARRMVELDNKHAEEKQQEKDRRMQAIGDTVAVANLAVPLGWLPYGARAAASGNPWPGLFGSLGMCLLGMASLWMSHRATIRMYTGKTKATKKRRVERKDVPRTFAAPFLEKTVWRCSEHVSVVTYAGIRNLLRAPEAKMALMSPIIMIAIFGTMLVLGPGKEMPVEAHPFIAVAGIALTMIGIAQLMINVFGSDRGGFRAFVLMPVARRDILLGKNLAIAPFAAGLTLVVIVLSQIVLPMKMMHFVATLIQLVPVYLVACLVGNATSMFAPMPVAAGSLKPVQPKFLPIMIQMFAVMMMPLMLLPGVGALLIELLLDKFAGGRWFPLYLIITIVELPLAVILYRFLLPKQGHLLQRREAKILEIVSSVVE